MADFWSTAGYDDAWGAAEMPAGGNDINPQGAADDPFDYTNGSLLTPWRGKFDGSKFGGGGSGVPDFKGFEHGEFGYTPGHVAGFDEQYKNPGDFTYGEYTGPGDFKGITAKDLKNDPGAQLRQQRAMKILTASKAAQGVLKTGGTAKALQRNAADLASEEFGAAYARKAGEHDRAVDASRFRYGTNRANAKDNFDTNVGNARTGFQVRQGAWRDNAAVAQENNRFGFDVAEGTYDRNLALRRQQYEDERSHASAVAAAGRAGADQAYNRALDEYQMTRDEFWTNQDRQHAILDREDVKGREAAFGYADRQSGYALDRGNAQAAGRVGGANAWNGAYGNIGNTIADYGMYAMTQRGGRTPARQPLPTPPSRSGGSAPPRPGQYPGMRD